MARLRCCCVLATLHLCSALTSLPPQGDKARRHLLLGTALAPASLLVPTANAADAKVFVPAPGTLKGRTILITGASTGLGLESAVRLASAGATVIGTARTEEKKKAMESDVRRRVPEGDFTGKVLELGSLKAIAQFSTTQPIDVLMLNAGVMALPEERRTDDGIERQIGVNFLGHFALTARLLPKMRPPFRVISVSSSANYGASERDVDAAISAPDLSLPSYSQWGSYCVSKAMNILFAAELQRRFDASGVRASSVALHPGAVATDLARYLIAGSSDATTTKDAVASSPLLTPFLKALSAFVLPIDQGANTQVFLAGADDLANQGGGVYYDSMRPATPNAITLDPALATRLFDKAASLSGLTIDEALLATTRREEEASGRAF